MKKGDTLGGVFEVVALGVPAGLCSYSQWDRKLEAKLAYAIMGIQAIKGVEIGLGFEMARKGLRQPAGFTGRPIMPAVLKAA